MFHLVAVKILFISSLIAIIVIDHFIEGGFLYV